MALTRQYTGHSCPGGVAKWMSIHLLRKVNANGATNAVVEDDLVRITQGGAKKPLLPYTAGTYVLQQQTLPTKYTHATLAAELGYRSDANGGATVVVFATDGNPSKAEDCGIDEAARIFNIAGLKTRVTRIIPIGIGELVDVGTLVTLSSGMPSDHSYLAAPMDSLDQVLDAIVLFACVPIPTTFAPSLAPTARPTTLQPTVQPTHSGGCTVDERTVCGWPANTQSVCSCGDQECSFKRCTCKGEFQCSTKPACTECTAAPTLAPTVAPSKAPSKAPSVAPSESPTPEPTVDPTHSPTTAPTETPTHAPSVSPSNTPTKSPTPEPSMAPTFSDSCDAAQVATCDGANGGTCSADGAGSYQCACPSGWGCSDAACGLCTQAPTQAPTPSPTKAPTQAPTQAPTSQPSTLPTTAPSEVPTRSPTASPTYGPSVAPTYRECFKTTVTFCTHPSHNLTRSP